MSTDRTPIDRAKEALRPYQDRAAQRTSWGEKSIPMLTLTADAAARAAVSAALHDPDDPDTLARLLFDASQQWVEADGVTTRLDWSNLHRSQQEQWRRAADAVRSAILGADQ